MYRFFIDIYNTSKQIYPKIDDASINWVREDGQFFSRASFPKLKIIGEDFDLINNGSIYYEYIIRWERWEDGEYKEVLRGTFTKADASGIDPDLRTMEIEPVVSDRYTNVLDKMDIEFDFLKYNPSFSRVKYRRKPIIQLYTLGSNKITNILGSRVWEQDCTTVSDLTLGGKGLANQILVNDYHFGNTPILKAFITGVGEGITPDVTGEYDDALSFNTTRNNGFQKGDYEVVVYGLRQTSGPVTYSGNDVDGYNGLLSFEFSGSSLDDTDFNSVWNDGTRDMSFVGKYDEPDVGEIYVFRQHGDQGAYTPPTTGTLTHVSGANNTASNSFTTGGKNHTGIRWRWAIYDNNLGEYVFIAPIQEYLNESPTYNLAATFTKATKNGTSGYIIDASTQVRLFQAEVYARTLYNENIDLGVAEADQKAVPEQDIIPNTPNYTLVEPLNLVEDQLVISDANSTTESLYGRFSSDAIHFSGNYFTEPTDPDDLLPVNEGQWTEVSIWFHHTTATNTIQAKEEEINLRHAYKLSTVIDTLLEQIDTNITHGGSSDVSDFLYGASNAIRGTKREVFITPKSNILTANYDTPATKSEISLANVVTMLKSVFNCHWDIDEDNKFIVEFVDYFMRGRSYTKFNYSADLTSVLNPRTGKAITSNNNKYNYEKQNIPEFIEIKFMDVTTDDFDGEYVECQDNFIQKGLIDTRSADKFTTDIDYMGLQPSSIGKSGFAIFEAILTNGEYVMVEENITIQGKSKSLLNGYLSAPYLQENYFIYNSPCNTLNINGTIHNVNIDGGTIKRNKIQEMSIPNVVYVDIQRLITTGIGAGLVIEKTEDIDSDGVLKIKIEHDTEL